MRESERASHTGGIRINHFDKLHEDARGSAPLENHAMPILFRNMLLDVPMNKNQRVVLLYSDGTLTWTRKMTRK